MRHELTISEPAGETAAIAAAIAALAAAGLQLRAPAVPALLALLAAGRFDRVQPLLRAGVTAGEARAFVVVLARFVAWTGDLHAAASRWHDVHAISGEIGPADTDDDVGVVLAAGALAGVERIATDLGDARTAASVGTAARAARARLERRLDGSGLEPLAAAMAVALGLVDGWQGSARSAAQAGAEPADATLAASALAVLRLVHGTLGLDPDATRHRLRLRPRAPATGRCEIRDIGFGDGAITLSLDRQPHRLVIGIEQVSGAIPVTALLEPVLTRLPVSATVDGMPAALTPRPLGADAVILPVQLVLDARRTVVIELDPDAQQR